MPGIEVTEPEVQRALQAQLRQFPGREKQLIDYYRANPDAIASLRAPIFEEKVIDYLLETKRARTRENDEGAAPVLVPALEAGL